MKTYLHIHHLDPGEEEIEVLSCLKRDGVLPKYPLEVKTEDGNSIVVYIGNFDDGNIEKNIEDILLMISDDTLQSIGRLQLNISLRLVVGGSCAYFSPRLLTIAGKKGIQIYVSNWKIV